MCALPISNGWSPKVLEILILTFVPPALVCTMSRRVWFRKLWACPGREGCGAVAHVPIHRLPVGFCAIASTDSSPMRPQVRVLANGLFMAPASQECLAHVDRVRRWIAVTVSRLGC